MAKHQKKPSKTPALTKEDREVVQNLELLQMMDMLKDMNVLAPTEEKK